MLKRRELPGFARVNKVTSVSLRYPLSVFNKNSTLRGTNRLLDVHSVPNYFVFYTPDIGSNTKGPLSTATNLVHRNSFPKLSNFPSYFPQYGKFRGEANDEKHADPGKKNRNTRKSRGNMRNLLEAFLRSRKEENLYGHSDMNNARRILSKDSTPLRLLVLVEKALFSKEFRSEFHSGGGGNFTFCCHVIFMTHPITLIQLVVIFFWLVVSFLFVQEQVAACYLDTHNVSGLPGVPPNEHDKAWVIVEELCVKVIDEVKGAEWWILHLRYGGNRTRAGTSPKSHTVYDLNHSANRVYTIGTGCSHHMWWEHSVPIVYTRLAG